MRSARRFSIVLFLACTAAHAAGRPARYVAMLSDGTRVEGDRLSNWYDSKGIPNLSGQHSLLSPANPFRWFRDRAVSLPDLPQAFIEFIGGDRLPGVVVDYRTGVEDPYHPLPPHLIVRVAVA